MSAYENGAVALGWAVLILGQVAIILGLFWSISMLTKWLVEHWFFPVWAARISLLAIQVWLTRVHSKTETLAYIANYIADEILALEAKRPEWKGLVSKALAARSGLVKDGKEGEA